MPPIIEVPANIIDGNQLITSCKLRKTGVRIAPTRETIELIPTALALTGVGKSSAV